MSHAPTTPPRAGRDRVADVHVPFVYAALAFAVLGGFSLAVTLSIEALVAGISVSWAVHAQLHGHLQVLGFAGLFVVGVGLRSFPTLFGMPAPSPALGRFAALLLQAGLALWAAGSLLDEARVAALGQVALGVGVLVLVSSFGFWRRETRFAAASLPLAWALRGALLSLTLVGVLLLTNGSGALIAERAVSVRVVDATRHVFALGVITLGIVGMAQLILPEFASERLIRQPSPRRAPLFAAALLTAMLLRGVVPLLPVTDTVRFASMSVGGTVAWIAVGAFAVLFIRARRAHLEYVTRMAKWRAGGDALPVVE